MPRLRGKRSHHSLATIAMLGVITVGVLVLLENHGWINVVANSTQPQHAPATNQVSEIIVPLNKDSVDKVEQIDK